MWDMPGYSPSQLLEQKPLIVLTGPTAAGKTALSIALAKRAGCEIISADSIQVYRHMDIGSAKISKEEMQGVPHYLIDEFMPDFEFNIYQFQKLAKQYVKQIYEKGKIPLVVGGTGFYIQSLLYDIDFAPSDEADEQGGAHNPYRRELEELAAKRGAKYLHHLLEEVDEESAKNIHANNIKRVIRALEYYRQTGEKISEHNKVQRQKTSPYRFAYFVLNHHRDILYKRIEQRIDRMIEDGLVEEVAHLKEMGYDRNLVSMQGLGYKEIYAYLEGECSLEEAVSVLKRDTRHFAKRQLTWFRRERDVIWMNYYDYLSLEDMLKEMLQTLKDREILQDI